MFESNIKNDSTNYEEFIKAISGQINEKRKQIIEVAFKKLDPYAKGVVPLDTIKEEYLADRHPDVLSKIRSEGEIITEFIDTFELLYTIKVIIY